MSADTTQPNHTEHALLVLLGQYAQHLGLIEALLAVPLHQKTYTHRPQAKILEFLVAFWRASRTWRTHLRLRRSAAQVQVSAGMVARWIRTRAGPARRYPAGLTWPAQPPTSGRPAWQRRDTSGRWCVARARSKKATPANHRNRQQQTQDTSAAM